VNARKMSQRHNCHTPHIRLRVISKPQAPPLYPPPIRVVERGANQGVRDLLRTPGCENSFQVVPHHHQSATTRHEANAAWSH
jgi:hypothetical protein